MLLRFNDLVLWPWRPAFNCCYDGHNWCKIPISLVGLGFRRTNGASLCQRLVSTFRFARHSGPVPRLIAQAPAEKLCSAVFTWVAQLLIPHPRRRSGRQMFA
jgi:hypothetical protein